LELNEITGTIDKHKDKRKYHILPIRRDITNFNEMFEVWRWRNL